MTTEVTRGGSAYADSAPQLLDSLLYAVSHDLRSPLLTVSLSAQLLEHALADTEVDGTSEALGGLRAACDDLERMLATLNALSRAARRAEEPIEIDCASFCAAAPAVTVLLDPLTAAELGASIPDDALVAEEPGAVLFRWSVDDLDGSPLKAVAGSLQNFAGGPIEALAGLEIALERHDASMTVAGSEVTVRLPVVPAVPS